MQAFRPSTPRDAPLGRMGPPPLGECLPTCTVPSKQAVQAVNASAGLNASVPRAAAFSVMVPAVCDDDSREIFGIFPAHLAPETKAEGSAKVGGQGLAIHAISEQRLRMESVCHVVGLPQCAHKCPALIGIRKWLEEDVSGLRPRSGKTQHRRQPHPGPFGNIGPTLLAGVQQYMTFGRQALDLFERKRYGTGN